MNNPQDINEAHSYYGCFQKDEVRSGLWNRFVYAFKDNYSNFYGRATPADFFSFAVMALIIGVFTQFGISAVLSMALEETPQSAAATAGLAVAVVFCLPFWSIGVRRFHDINLSGWWLLPAAFFVIPALILLVQPSYPRSNRYGTPEP